MSLPRIAITIGDPAGVGPEILAKALADRPDGCLPIAIGDRGALVRASQVAGAKLDWQPVTPPFAQLAPPRTGQAYVYDLDNLTADDYRFGEISAAAGRAAGESIEQAIRLALADEVAAVVTNPIHKEAFILGGYGQRYPGHTEMFADLTGAKHYCMMLAAGPLRVCHVTTHVSLRRAILDHIKQPRIAEVTRLADQACRRLGIVSPRIGVAALNPHGGEDGTFGDEEITEIKPAIDEVRAEGINADGPVPADTLFSKARGGMYDAVVAMYHDQGHIPAKLLGFVYDHQTGEWDMQGVNVTLGLPIIRTSVDHGTAFDKAGRGIADHRSLLDAIAYAVGLATGRAR